MRRLYKLGSIMAWLSLSLFSSALARDEQISISTYYPSPFGSYKELTAYRMKIGVNFSNPSNSVADNNIIIEGRVGVGMANPGGPYDNKKVALDVNNYAAVNDVYLKQPVEGKPRWASQGFTSLSEPYECTGVEFGVKVCDIPGTHAACFLTGFSTTACTPDHTACHVTYHENGIWRIRISHGDCLGSSCTARCLD